MGKSGDARNPANVIAGRNLKYFMDTNGISNQQLAESFGIEKESVQKILSGRNAISGPYNYILLNNYNCDLNFIYGGIARCDTLINDIGMVEEAGAKGKLWDAVLREMRYLVDLLDKMNKMDDVI